MNLQVLSVFLVLFLFCLSRACFKKFGLFCPLYIRTRYEGVTIVRFRKNEKRELGPFCTAKKIGYVSGQEYDEHVIENANPEKLGLVGMSVFFKRQNGMFHVVDIGRKIPHSTRDQNNLEISAFDFYALIPEELASNRIRKQKTHARSAFVPSH